MPTNPKRTLYSPLRRLFAGTHLISSRIISSRPVSPHPVAHLIPYHVMSCWLLPTRQRLPQTVVDRLAAVVADGGPAAANLGRLARNMSAQLGYREQGSTAAADSARPYLGGAAQDPELLAAETSLGLGRGAGAAPTAGELRSAGQTLGRQAHSAFEAMATAADVSNGNPALLPNVISHQLGPMPRLLDGFVSGCTAIVPPSPAVLAVPGAAAAAAAAGVSNSSTTSAAKDAAAAAAPPLSNKRVKEECDDGDVGPPEKKMALEHKSGLTACSTAASRSSVAGGDNGGAASVKSENGQGASSSPATAAPPASSNLLARPASADFRHGGGEELMALLKAKVGRLFSLDAEYTHVRMGDVPHNGTPAARGGGEGIKDEGTGAAAAANGGTTAAPTAIATAAAAQDASPSKGLRSVLSLLKAERAGHFVVHVKFDIAGKNTCRPCDISVLSWKEAQESAAAASGNAAGGGGAAANAAVKAEGDQGGSSDFMGAVDGSKPWRTSQHTAFVRVSGHAFQVTRTSVMFCCVACPVLSCPTDCHWDARTRRSPSKFRTRVAPACPGLLLFRLSLSLSRSHVWWLVLTSSRSLCPSSFPPIFLPSSLTPRAGVA